MTLNLKELSFKVDNATKYTDDKGIFKNFMNIENYLKMSGTWSNSKLAYWNLNLESFKIHFSVGNDLFLNNKLENKIINNDKMNLLL